MAETGMLRTDNWQTSILLGFLIEDTTNFPERPVAVVWRLTLRESGSNTG